MSLGGGTICYNKNIDLIKNPKNISFYLKLNATKLSERLYNIKSKRPLLSSIDNENNLLEYISKHLFEEKVIIESLITSLIAMINQLII